MSTQNNELDGLVHAESLAAAAAAGELVFGETIDPDTVLPSVADSNPDNALVVTTIRLRQAQKRKVQAEAERRGTDVATLIRGWVDEGLAALDNDYQVSAAALRRAIAELGRPA
ncbi:hypothetical protein [Nocardia sp. NPDC050710]|uniref:hypothetical protein n=1 Tax=Nocardia sp. NPDC050710 TaxID=3157220 RepID=UPI00340EEB4C